MKTSCRFSALQDPMARAEHSTGFAPGTKFVCPQTSETFEVEYETVRPGHYKMVGTEGTSNIEQLIRLGDLVPEANYMHLTDKHGPSFWAR